MASEHSFALLTGASSLAEAHIIAAVLEENGIPARVEDTQLMDQFAISQRAMGLGVRIEVPEPLLERAQEILREVRAANEDGEEGGEAASDDGS